MNSIEEIDIFISFDVEKVKEIINSLEGEGLVSVERKRDESYNEDFWQCSIEDKARGIYEDYQEWIEDIERKGK